MGFLLDRGLDWEIGNGKWEMGVGWCLGAEGILIYPSSYRYLTFKN